MSVNIQMFYDPPTFTLTYLVYDEASKDAIVIDPVLNFDNASGRISYESIDELLSFVDEKKLKLHYALETHAHADHLSGALELKKRRDLKIAIGSQITLVQEVFKGVFNLKSLSTNGDQFDVLLKDDQSLNVGSFEVKTIHTPGHTPACVSYLIEDHLFTGDALFMPDFGTGRCDFPKGDAKDLYHSIHEKLYALPDTTKIYVGHDYQPGGRELEYQSTIGESKEKNIQLKGKTTRDEFVKFRTERDEKLSAPRLLLPSIQVNIRAGRLPEAEDNGMSYLKLPLKQ